MNAKDERILKFHRQGCSAERIARKLGIPGNVERVREGLLRCGVKVEEIENQQEGGAL
jgi:hypothetical protein